ERYGTDRKIEPTSSSVAVGGDCLRLIRVAGFGAGAGSGRAKVLASKSDSPSKRAARRVRSDPRAPARNRRSGAWLRDVDDSRRISGDRRERVPLSRRSAAGWVWERNGVGEAFGDQIRQRFYRNGKSSRWRLVPVGGGGARRGSGRRRCVSRAG